MLQKRVIFEPQTRQNSFKKTPLKYHPHRCRLVGGNLAIYSLPNQSKQQTNVVTVFWEASNACGEGLGVGKEYQVQPPFNKAISCLVVVQALQGCCCLTPLSCKCPCPVNTSSFLSGVWPSQSSQKLP